MIAAWMLYVIVTSLLLAGAAAAVEAGLRRLGRPARIAWIAALAGSITLAAAPWLGGGDAPAPASSEAAPPPGQMIELPALEIGAASALERLDGPLLALWGAGSLAVILALLGGAAVLARRRRRWAPAELDGRPVLLSDDFGPAVVGLLRQGVVLPRWVAQLDPPARRMVLLHEEEHRRAGDVPLLAAAAATAALLPWNLPLWLQLRRLRAAVELDCDRRVLARGARPLPYADLLLRVGGRAAGVLSPALAEPAQTLERRLEMIVKKPKRWSRWTAAASMAVAVLLVGLACELPTPSGADEAPAAESGPETVDVMGEAVAGEPLVFVDGVEQDREILESLDPDRIERIEVLKAGAAEAAYGERGRDGVIQISTRGASGAPSAPPPGPSPSAEEIAAGPTFTPFTVAPDILNRAAIIAAMERAYPPLLREAGIGGTIRIHFLIDETGSVAETRVDESSGHQALDQAALRVASTYSFSPALNDEKAVPVWISLPITFKPSS